eukprot:TRINITY_DN74920_c0_g1_i1.p1 TRINITY_DN74920_c0_g1~~TRINITY_DN74920_c0_g1_i1.p1  ORF type:complete len:799 (-),score=98.30 TRINITY_DN74920_c0_g1_i1:79-2475(-)
MVALLNRPPWLTFITRWRRCVATAAPHRDRGRRCHRGWGGAFLIRVLLLKSATVCTGLYDPVRHIASARLYGNIEALAYYYVDLLVGSPPQRVSVILDTGSSLLGFPCSNCGHCGRHIDPAFDFERSSSASWVRCGDEQCQCQSGHCSYHVGYTEGSAISGYFFEDRMFLGDALQHNPAVVMRMGCHQNENNLFYTQQANGIFGVGPQARTLKSLFLDVEHIEAKIFSICLAEWGGRFTVGGINESLHTGPTQYVSVDTTGGHYYVQLDSLEVDGQVVSSSSFGRTMIDSGTTFTYMGRGPYQALRKGIESYCAQRSSCGGLQQGECWEVPHIGAFPNVTSVFGGGVRVRWAPKAYLYRAGDTTRNVYCYGFMDDGPRASTVLGVTWMIYQDVIFDQSASRVGIAGAACPEYRVRPPIETIVTKAMTSARPATLNTAAAASTAYHQVTAVSSTVTNITGGRSDRTSGVLVATTTDASAAAVFDKNVSGMAGVDSNNVATVADLDNASANGLSVAQGSGAGTASTSGVRPPSSSQGKRDPEKQISPTHTSTQRPTQAVSQLPKMSATQFQTQPSTQPRPSTQPPAHVPTPVPTEPTTQLPTTLPRVQSTTKAEADIQQFAQPLTKQATEQASPGSSPFATPHSVPTSAPTTASSTGVVSKIERPTAQTSRLAILINDRLLLAVAATALTLFLSIFVFCLYRRCRRSRHGSHRHVQLKEVDESGSMPPQIVGSLDGVGTLDVEGDPSAETFVIGEYDEDADGEDGVWEGGSFHYGLPEDRASSRPFNVAPSNTEPVAPRL